MTFKLIKPLAAVAALTLLGACLNTDGERAIAGALGGALVADALDKNIVAGAAAGAAAGALCDDVNLCK